MLVNCAKVRRDKTSRRPPDDQAEQEDDVDEVEEELYLIED